MPPKKQPSPETEFRPALTANTPSPRVFARDMPGSEFPYRRRLYADNTRGSGIITLKVHASTYFERKAGIGGIVEVEDVGQIRAYTLESTVTEAADVVTVYENGGLTEE